MTLQEKDYERQQLTNNSEKNYLQRNWPRDYPQVLAMLDPIHSKPQKNWQRSFICAVRPTTI